MSGNPIYKYYPYFHSSFQSCILIYLGLPAPLSTCVKSEGCCSENTLTVYMSFIKAFSSCHLRCIKHLAFLHHLFLIGLSVFPSFLYIRLPVILYFLLLFVLLFTFTPFFVSLQYFISLPFQHSSLSHLPSYCHSLILFFYCIKHFVAFLPYFHRFTCFLLCQLSSLSLSPPFATFFLPPTPDLETPRDTCSLVPLTPSQLSRPGDSPSLPSDCNVR